MDEEDNTLFWLDHRADEDRMWDGLHTAQSDHWGQDDVGDVADQEVESD